MNAKLTLVVGSAESDVPLQSLPLVVGRGTDVGLKLCDPWVSRRHCEIFETDGHLVVRDRGSKYGTWVNGHRVTEVTLNPGDRVSVGLSTLVASYDSRAFSD